MRRKSIRALMCAAVALCTASIASADTFTLNYGFSGTTPDAGPWAQVTITDVSANTVKVKMESAGSWAGFIDSFYFNIDPNVTGFSVSTVTGQAASTVTYSPDAYKADGDGLFDLYALGSGAYSFRVNKGAFIAVISAGQ